MTINLSFEAALRGATFRLADFVDLCLLLSDRWYVGLMLVLRAQYVLLACCLPHDLSAVMFLQSMVGGLSAMSHGLSMAGLLCSCIC